MRLLSDAPICTTRLRIVAYRLLVSHRAAAPAGTAYEELTVGVPKETAANENRVGITPANVAMFKKAGFNVNIEKGAGAKSFFTDAAYEEQVNNCCVSGAWLTLLVRRARIS